MPLAYRLQSLGRPVFTTNIDGAVIWDVGTPTPFGDDASTNAAFGEAVQTAGAFAQRLMFPGQYQDAETGTDIVLSHNHHRTYDPTLGRYLQSDPIGLAGGLNRYAYVGVGYVDPEGLRWVSSPDGYWKQHDNKYNIVEKAQFIHFNRNVFNSNLPCFPPVRAGDEWEELTGWSKVGFHRFPTSFRNPLSNFGNRKFVSRDGAREVIFDRKGRRVSNRINAGTFNYRNPIDNPVAHSFYDIVPFFVLGNGPSGLENDCTCRTPQLRGLSKI